MRGPRRFTDAERNEIWDRIAAGHSVAAVAAAFNRYPSAIRAVVRATGGVRPSTRRRSDRALTLCEREEISRGLSANQPCRVIATRLGPSALYGVPGGGAEWWQRSLSSLCC
jgi:IS30 family transposase